MKKIVLNKTINPLISVIVPVYKAEEHLPRCIESILNQTLKNNKQKN